MTRRFFVQLVSLASALVSAPWAGRAAGTSAQATTGDKVYTCSGCGQSVRLRMRGATFQVAEGTRFPELRPWRLLPEGRLVGLEITKGRRADTRVVQYSVRCAECAAKKDAEGSGLRVQLTEPEQLSLEGVLDRDILLQHGVPLRF